MNAVLEVRDVTFTYPKAAKPALEQVGLTVEAGQCVGLLGPNGAGKTTLVSCVTGLGRPDRGAVRVAGGDPTRAATRRALGVMLQQAAFPRHLTVAELVGGAAVRYGRAADACEPVLDEVGLADLAGRRGGQLSGGQRQRLQLARALVADPDLLVLDEPTAGLDAEARRQFWENLSARRDAGMAILLTTHIIEEAGAVADRVAVIGDGRIVADADPASLTDRLPDRTVTAVTDLPVELVSELPGVSSCVRDGPRLRVVSRAAEDLLRELLDRDPALSGLRVEGSSLEEAVLALTRRDVQDEPSDAEVPTPAGSVAGGAAS